MGMKEMKRKTLWLMFRLWCGMEFCDCTKKCSKLPYRAFMMFLLP